MASGLPIVASDLAVHREICGAAAVYFHRFSPEELAEKVLCVAASEDTAQRLAHAGAERATAFSWERHVDQILSLARTLQCTTGSAEH